MSRSKQYVYFVSYICNSPGGFSSGMSEVKSPAPYTTYADILGCVEAIVADKPGTTNVTVISYQLMRTEVTD